MAIGVKLSSCRGGAIHPTPLEPRPAVFLDRDGTIIREVGYLSSPDQIQLFPSTIPALRLLQDMGFLLFVISNQSGVARGFFPEKNVAKVHAALAAMLQEAGIHIHRFYYCPHHPEATVPAYRQDCQCRKPRPGMLHQACQEFPVVLQQSVVIGDKLIDVETGKRLNLTAILVLTGYGRQEKDRLVHVPENLHPDAIVPDILQAARWIQNTRVEKKK